MLKLSASQFTIRPCIDAHALRRPLTSVIPVTKARRRGLLTLAIESSW